MNLRLLFAGAIATLAAGAFAQSTNNKPNTFWIFGPFGVEHQLGQSTRPATVGIYLAGIVKDDGGSNTLKLGPALEYMTYSGGNASGLGLGARVTFADGVSAGPTVAYVTRPSGNGVAFRIGVTFPFGNDAVPFAPEIGIGFRF
jgi:hypothetical protein